MILELLQKSMKMKFSSISFEMEKMLRSDGTIMEVVPLPDADFLIGFNAWTACYNDKDFRLYQQDDLEYYKLSEIRLSIYPDFEAARAPLIG